MSIRMLPRANRLQKNLDFERVFSKRAGVRGTREFVVFFMPNQRAVSRFGFVVSKKFGKAVRRSRMKRLCREAVRHNLDQIKPGYDIVITVKKQNYNKKLWDTQRELLYILRKVNLLGQRYDMRGYARKVLPEKGSAKL